MKTSIFAIVDKKTGNLKTVGNIGALCIFDKRSLAEKCMLSAPKKEQADIEIRERIINFSKI